MDTCYLIFKMFVITNVDKLIATGTTMHNTVEHGVSSLLNQHLLTSLINSFGTVFGSKLGEPTIGSKLKQYDCRRVPQQLAGGA